MRRCIDCQRSDVELRPYGPGGALICFDCGQKPQRRDGVKAAMRAAFDRVDVAVSMPGLGVVSPEEAAKHVRCKCGRGPTLLEEAAIAQDLRRAARVPTSSIDAPTSASWCCSRCRSPAAGAPVCFLCCLPILADQERGAVDLKTKDGLKPYPVHAGCSHTIGQVLGLTGVPTLEGWIERTVEAIRESERMGMPPIERERLGEQLEGFRLQLEAMGVQAELCSQVRELVGELSPRLQAKHARERAGLS